MGNGPGRACCQENTTDPFEDDTTERKVTFSSKGVGTIKQLLRVLECLEVQRAELKGVQAQAHLLGSQARIMQGFHGEHLSMQDTNSIAALGAYIDDGEHTYYADKSSEFSTPISTAKKEKEIPEMKPLQLFSLETPSQQEATKKEEHPKS